MNITQTFLIDCELRRCSIAQSRIEPMSALPDEFGVDAAVIRNGEFSDCHLVGVRAFGCQFDECHFDAHSETVARPDQP
jgi:hypothetical protein